MKDYIKKALDDFVKNKPQINLDSEAARAQIAEHVAHRIKESLINETKDKCVICGCVTEYDEFDHIDKRYYYVEGAGQVCPKCY